MNNSKQQVQVNQWFLVAVISVMFIVACFIVPQLAWVFFSAFLVSMISLYFFKSDTVKNQIISEQESQLNAAKTALSTSQQPLAEALQFPAYILDVQGKIIYANKPSKNAFGDVNTGDKIFIRFRQPELRQLIKAALNSKESVTGEYNEPMPGDRWFSFEIAPIPNYGAENDKPVFLLGFHDLTEVKRNDQMRSDFIANASHELRTPLASLLGYVETIKGPARKDDKAIDRFTDVMLDQAQRMARLVNDLLSLSRIEMQSHVRPSHTVNLSEIVTSVVKSLGSVADQLNVKIEYKAPGVVNILGDRDELLQVFENLIENACKYGEEGEKVIVSIDQDNDQKQVTVSIQDFGPGIALEHQQRITERFYRVDVARSRAKQGTGLGLAIVKHILNRHATKLSVESKPNEGARFFIKFPLHKVPSD